MATDVFEHNRVILFHFDSYSALLSFARFGRTMLAPGALPDGAMPSSPREPGPAHAPAPVLAAIAERYGLELSELTPVDDFDAWAYSDSGPVRVHLVRIRTFEPPRALLAAHDGTFKPVSEMRGIPPHELGYAREVFDLVMGGR